MKVVDIRELRAHLRRYLRFVRRLGPVSVSDGGRVVAELRSLPGTNRDLPEGLRQLAEEGRLRVGARNGPASYPVLDPVASKPVSAVLLDEERG
jgi:antitoxin (DNA-binding transcriptional repressor) of toxin-antitoxin stability system